MTTRVAAAIALALAACGRFGFDAIVDDGNNGSNGSGTSDSNGDPDALGSGCLSPGTGDSFDEIAPCSQWGTQITNNATLSDQNGALTISLLQALSTDGGCTRSNVPFGPAGAFVQIGQGPGYGTLELAINDGTNTWTIEISTGEQLLIVEPGPGMLLQLTWDPVSMAWLRMRPLNGVVVYETSPDAFNWTLQYTGMFPAPTTITLTVDNYGNLPSPGATAVVDGIDVCP